MTKSNRRTVLKTGAAFAGASVLGFPAIASGQSDKIKVGHLTPLTGFEVRAPHRGANLFL